MFRLNRFMLFLVLLLAALVIASLLPVWTAAADEPGVEPTPVAADAPVIVTAAPTTDATPVFIVEGGGMSFGDLFLLAICGLFFMGFAGQLYINHKQGKQLGESYPPGAMKEVFNTSLGFIESLVKATPNKLDDSLFASIKAVSTITNAAQPYENEPSG